MQDALLSIMTVAVFSFGYFIMKKLDCYLESNQQDQTPTPTASENSLKNRNRCKSRKN